MQCTWLLTIFDRHPIVWLAYQRRPRGLGGHRYSKSRAGIPSEPRYRRNNLVFTLAQ